MSAREEILARVQAATSGTANRLAPSGVVRNYYRATSALDRREQIDLFVERVEDYKATVHRCAAEEVSAAISTALAGRQAVVDPGFAWPVTGAIPDTTLSHAELDEMDAVVTSAAIAIAETGTVVLDHGPGQGRRAISLIPDLHVCVVYANQIVADVPDAFAGLDATRPQTWISGPSATSDIELNRVEGVHGPRTLHVIVVD